MKTIPAIDAEFREFLLRLEYEVTRHYLIQRFKTTTDDPVLFERMHVGRWEEPCAT